MTEKEFRMKVMPMRRLMYCMALKMGMPPDDAADAVQETQIRLWRRRDGLPPDLNQLKSYCIASLRNECLTLIRLRRETEPIDEKISQADETAEIFEIKDVCRHIEIMINRLPKGQQQAIRLRAFGEFETPEIAEAMGQSESNIRQLLSRGRKRLREMLANGKFD